MDDMLRSCVCLSLECVRSLGFSSSMFREPCSTPDLACSCISQCSLPLLKQEITPNRVFFFFILAAQLLPAVSEASQQRRLFVSVCLVVR